MNYFNLSSSTAFLYSLYKYLCCREKVEGDLYEGYYEGEESKQIYPKLDNLITPTNSPRDTNLHSRYQSKKFT